MAERYVENILIRQDGVLVPEGDLPTFNDNQCDKVFEFEGTIVLKQIVKNVQNALHNRHDYVFQIKEITKLQEQGE